MAGQELPAEYLKGGEEYLTNLRSLGLDPDFLGWGWETSRRSWLLVMSTSLLDASGPLALNELLFKAYNAGATTKLISPFIVKVFSSESDFVRKNLPFLHVEASTTLRAVESGKTTSVIRAQYSFMGIEMNSDNTYVVKRRNKKYHDQRSEWLKFRRNVEKLAA